jgi:3-oxoacyl-[acyl-carrier protein] reductase
MNFNGKTVVITGGSRGIGAATAEAFVDAGADVFVLSRSENSEKAALLDRASKTGASYTWIETDISDDSSLEKALDTIFAQQGKIDILVNNAGITRDGLLMRMSKEDWDAVIATNLSAVFTACKKVLRPMLKARGGSIINISSVVGIVGNGGQTNYSASKAGIIGFTKSLAREVASREIRVNAVAPGYIDTDMTARLNEEARKALTAQIPFGRTGKPEEVARTILFLASEEASYITGQVLVVDGGLAM